MTASSRNHEDDLERIQDALVRYYDADDFVSVPAMVLVGWADSSRQGARFQPKDFLDQLPPPPPPVLPTTPGSVVLHNGMHWLFDRSGWSRGAYFVSSFEMGRREWSLVFDAGAHDEGKTS